MGKGKNRGMVYLVGAGPGDPALITVKGLKLVRKADVIVYDFLVDRKLLTSARKGAELICAGKSSLYHSMEQDEINKLLVESSKKAGTVVRLKNGDPFILGRGAEEAIYLAEHNIPYEVVPGLSSATAVPASVRVPLTHRDYASSLAIITGHRKGRGRTSPVRADTLVFLMPMANLEKIIKKLLKEGRPAATPCILIEKGTLAGQKIVQGNLGNILEKAKEGEAHPPAVLVVGKVVSLRERLNRNKKKILFTGTNPERFKSLGQILHQPLIKITPLADYSGLKREIEHIHKYHWLIFTSRYGVEYFFRIFNKMKKDIRRLKIGVIGQTTAARLKEYGFNADYIPGKESSAGLVEILQGLDLKDKNILIPRSNLADDYLPRALKKMGAGVKTIAVYKTIRPSRVKKINLQEIDEIIFTSPSTVKNFMAIYKVVPERIKIKCMGEVTQAKLKAYGFDGEVMAG